MLAFQQPTASGSRRVKLAMFKKALEKQAMDEAYKNIKHEMHDREVVDQSGLFGPRHRINERIRQAGALTKIADLDQLMEVIRKDNHYK